MPTLQDLLNASDAKASQGNWWPACNGTEQPFIARSGKRLLYMYQPSTGKHAYLDCESDLILSDEEARIYLATW
jgi:hypothetical protein